MAEQKARRKARTPIGATAFSSTNVSPLHMPCISLAWPGPYRDSSKPCSTALLYTSRLNTHTAHRSHQLSASPSLSEKHIELVSDPSMYLLPPKARV
jgi:hypothetical protein